MRWHIDLIHAVASVLAALGLWTVAEALRVALAARRRRKKGP